MSALPKTYVTPEEYLMVSQDEPLVERQVRQPNGDWFLTEFNCRDDVVDLASIGCRLPLREIYDKITFDRA